VFSTYYNIDWLAINSNEKWIGYRADGFKVLWWFNYQQKTKVTRIFSNLYEQGQMNWNMITNTLVQINKDGNLQQSSLKWDLSDKMNQVNNTL
jgi:hypothetical protein